MPTTRATLFMLAAVLAVGGSLRGADDDVLRTLRGDHPRLFVLDADVARVRAQVATDARARGWRASLQARAEAMLEEPPVERVLDGPRLLAQSRKALDRISTLAGLYRLDRDPRFLERARREMLAAATFADWNPSHFLDVAEMTAALAIGYDWLHAELPPEDRTTIRRAIVEKGLRPGLGGYEKGAWWAIEGSNNWTQVCNGGLVAGALAVAREEPALAARLVDLARGDGMRRRLAKYAPDGGDEEGPGYWAYATIYTAYHLAALETALGTDFGLADAEGLANTGTFRMHSLGPTGAAFNYADAKEGVGDAPQMLWMARRFARPEYAAHERGRVAHPSIFHLFWNAQAPQEAAAAPPLAAWFEGVDVVFMRGAWDARATWVGFKGGDNRASHGHLDLGSFVMETRGQRWAVDLGPDDYNLPGYFGDKRWSYYRLRTESHNTLQLATENQAVDAKAPIVSYASTPGRTFAVADLTQAWAPRFTRARRGLALLGGTDVLVQDELEAEAVPEVSWQMLTRATVSVDGTEARLSQGGERLFLRVLEPVAARIEVAPAAAPSPQAQQPDVRAVRVIAPPAAARQRLVILLTDGAAQKAGPEITPLDDWVR